MFFWDTRREKDKKDMLQDKKDIFQNVEKKKKKKESMEPKKGQSKNTIK